MMKKEFKIWRSLIHRNILELITVFETDSTVHMVTEKLHMTLHGFLRRYGFIKRDKARELLREVLEGVRYMH